LSRTHFVQLLTDDPARSLEVRDHRFGHEQWCSDIYIEDLCVVCCSGFCDGSGEENTCIVDQNVDLVSEGFESCFHYLVRCVFSREIRLDNRGVAAVVEGLDLCFDLVGELSTLGRGVDQCDLREIQ
jgi:hypothetical protein